MDLSESVYTFQMITLYEAIFFHIMVTCIQINTAWYVTTDPGERLALFTKHKDSGMAPAVGPRAQRQLHRVDYFQGVYMLLSSSCLYGDHVYHVYLSTHPQHTQ